MSTTTIEKYHPLVKDLLTKRGLKEEFFDEFLNPDYELGTHDPFLMKGMEVAVQRVLEAIDKDEKIVVYSDFDADGIPGAVLMHDFFKKIGYKNFENYIPHRNDEGYGFHKEAIEGFAKSGTKLIVTVDVGITSVAEVEYVNSLGLEVIITDHHEPNGHLPEALVILNPKQKDCTYPEKMLCGTGVAFKLIQGILAKRDFGIKKGMEKWWLDLVGLATLSDMVPLLGENRVFARYGLLVLQKTSRPGLLQLFRKLKISQKHLNEDDIGFMVTPRINAASRMGHPDDAFNLLSATDETTAGAYVDHLNAINDKRKGVVSAIIVDIKKRLRKKGEIGSVLVLGHPSCNLQFWASPPIA